MLPAHPMSIADTMTLVAVGDEGRAVVRGGDGARGVGNREEPRGALLSFTLSAITSPL